MQAATGIPIDLVVVIQALVIMFVAAPALIREIYRIKVQAGDRHRDHGQGVAAHDARRDCGDGLGRRHQPPGARPRRSSTSSLAAIIVLVFAQGTEPGAETTFGLNLGAEPAIKLPDLVVPSAPAIYLVAGVCAFCGRPAADPGGRRAVGDPALDRRDRLRRSAS